MNGNSICFPTNMAYWCKMLLSFTVRTLGVFLIFLNSSVACYYHFQAPQKASTNLIIDMGDITTQKDAIGGILATKDGLMSTFGGAPASMGCGQNLNGSNPELNAPVSTKVYISGSNGQEVNQINATNIPGIGIKLYYYSTVATAYGNEPLTPTQAGTSFNVNLPHAYYSHYQNMNAAIKVELVQTGPISAIQAGKLVYAKNAFMWADSWAPVYLVDLTVNATVTVNTCDIDASSPLSVTLAGEDVANLPIKGSTSAGTPFNIILRCNGYTNVNMSVSSSDESNEIFGEGVLAIQEGGEMASGIGVQLIYDNESIEFDTSFSVGDSSDGLFNIPMIAKYYRTTNTPAKAGKVVSNMTYTLTYL